MARQPIPDRELSENEVLFCNVMKVYVKAGYVKEMDKQANALARVLLFPKQSNAFAIAMEYGKHSLTSAAKISVLINPGKEKPPIADIAKARDICEEYFDD